MKSLNLSDFNRYARFISIQPQYSLVCRSMDREVLPLCLEENVGVIPWAPLGGGFLTGRYERGNEPTEGRLSNKKNGESRWELRNTDKNFRILDEVLGAAAETNKTPAQVALNWLIHKQGITSPISALVRLNSLKIIWERSAGSFPTSCGSGWMMSARWNRNILTGLLRSFIGRSNREHKGSR